MRPVSSLFSFFIVVLLFGCFKTSGQTIDHFLITTQGTEWHQSSGSSMLFSIGEWYMDSGETCSYQEGFLQSFMLEACEFVNTKPIDQKLAIDIFPNPCIDYVNIKTYNYQLDKISLLSSDGKVILSQYHAGNTAMIKLSELPSNLYYIKVDYEDAVEYFKILKI